MRTYKYASFFKHLICTTDYLLLNLSLIVGFHFQHSVMSLFSGEAEAFRLGFLVINLFWFCCSTLVGLYENIMKKEAVPTINSMFAAFALYAVLAFLMSLIIPSFGPSLKFLILSSALFFVLIGVSRMVFLLIRKKKRLFWVDHKSVVIVGAGAVGRDLYKYFQSNPHQGYMVAGFFDDDLHGENDLVLGKVEDCFEYARQNGVSEIFCALSGAELEKVRVLMREAERNMIRFRLVPDLKAFFNTDVMLELYDRLPVLSPRHEPLENKSNEVAKKAFDFSVSLIVSLFILSWLVPLMAIIIKLDSKGPVFFKQLRSGKDNKPFYCYKFRSMKVNQDADSKQATKGDRRVTRIGAFLRKTSLDELPQFFNVLRGDMSIVGPRPHMLKHTEDYSKLVDSFMARHFVTPGITGWAQVTGYRGETKQVEDMAKRVEADLYYLENWSLILDLKIIFLTVWQGMIGSEKAY